MHQSMLLLLLLLLQHQLMIELQLLPVLQNNLNLLQQLRKYIHHLLHLELLLQL